MTVHLHTRFALIVVSIHLVVLSRLTHADNSNYFLYPLLNSVPPNVQAGDAVNVSWVSNWPLPMVTVWCGDASTIQRDLVQTVPRVSETGSELFVVASDWVDSCVFELVDSDNTNITYFASGEISIGNEERSPTTWGVGVQLFDASSLTSLTGTTAVPPSGVSFTSSSEASSTSTGVSSTASVALSTLFTISSTSSTASPTPSAASSVSRPSIPVIPIPTTLLTAQAPSAVPSPSSIIVPLASAQASPPSTSPRPPSPASLSIWGKAVMALAISVGVLLAAGLGWYIPHRRAKKMAERKRRNRGARVVDPWWYDHPPTMEKEERPETLGGKGHYELDGTPRTEIEECASRKGVSSLRTHRARGLGIAAT